MAAGNGALTKQSDCNAHDKTCSTDFQGIKSKSRVFCFFLVNAKKKDIFQKQFVIQNEQSEVRKPLGSA